MKKIIIAAVILLAPFFASASIDKNLVYGMQHDKDVQELQEYLIDKGFFKGNATGNFFSLTLKAVKSYQKSIGLKGTGFVGSLTRVAINKDLTDELTDSNTEAVGENTPNPTPPVTTKDVVNQLQNLQTTVNQQNTIIQQQQTQLQQIQQNTQQIVQNTCLPNWQCNTWSVCTNSQQTRICNDNNNCGVSTNRPVETQSCAMTIKGCMDSTAVNYNPDAKENGVCTYSTITMKIDSTTTSGISYYRFEATGEEFENTAMVQNFLGDDYTIAWITSKDNHWHYGFPNGQKFVVPIGWALFSNTNQMNIPSAIFKGLTTGKIVTLSLP